MRLPSRKNVGRTQQVVRRLTLAFFLCTLFVLPLAHLAQASSLGQGTLEVQARARGAQSADNFGFLESSAVTGNLWSFEAGGLEVADPLAAATFAAASHSLSFLLAALIPFLLTLVLGRFFCGWVCPARLPVELAAWIRGRIRKRFKKGPIPISLPRSRSLKYFILVGGLCFAYVSGWNLLVLFYPPAVFAREGFYLLAYGTLGWGAVFLGLAFVGDVLVESGIWCRSLCPGGALYSALGTFAPIKITVDPELCVTCPKCHQACPLGLDPTVEINEGECDRCGLCQTACPKDAINYSVHQRT